MTLEICAIGGHSEIGRNMTAVKIDDEVVILDMGLHLPNYIQYTEESQEDVVKASTEKLRQVEAIPNDKIIEDWREKVKAIIPSHGHLDHIGAIPYLAQRYDAPIVGTPYTLAVLKSILKDEKIKICNFRKLFL